MTILTDKRIDSKYRIAQYYGYRRDYYELQKRKKFLGIDYWSSVWTLDDELMEMDQDSVIVNMMKRITLLEGRSE